MIWTKRDTIICLVLACIAGFLFIPFLGSVQLFDGDEIRNAEIAREMMITGDYFRTQSHFQPSWEKPPFFFWLQVLAMKAFGVNEFAARFPNALLGMIMLPLLYVLGKSVSARGNVGVLWALTYAGSIFPMLSHKFGFVEPWYNVFTLLSVYSLAGYYAPPSGKIYSMRRIALGGVAIGLALVTNGILALVLVLLQWLLFWFVRRRTEAFPLTELAVYCALSLAVSLLWYGAELWQSGLWFFREFAQYHVRLLINPAVAADGQSFALHIPLLYQLLLPLVGCFPASVFVVQTVKTFGQTRLLLRERDTLTTFTLLMTLLLLLAVLLYVVAQTSTLYAKAPQMDIAQIISLAYLPITFLAARTLDGLLRGTASLSRLATALVISLGVLWIGILTLIPLVGMNTTWLLERTTDVFLRGNLQANVGWSAWEFLIAFGFALALSVSVYFLYLRRYFEMAFTLFPAATFAALCFTITVAPKIEGYRQSAAIEFYQSLRGKSCYIQTLGFSTCADIFYSQQQPSESASAMNIPPEEFELWLLEDEIDRTAYFVCKTHDAVLWRKHRNLTELYEKNGFVFFQREPKKKLNLAKKGV